ncbi:hypothetical protein CPB83DRAFT_896852 [Crepidotus variabilis]|uniref:Zn(2)-C6 fungal-type domain-containing protein n=1 Tax=Crepidotus variabilis TaxID=179855 RepID=A0A9P6EB96_9AGAR|nr:hypothetical protein CPB83DRAFT_896852 [Crepidotus variabilis]
MSNSYGSQTWSQNGTNFPSLEGEYDFGVHSDGPDNQRRHPQQFQQSGQQQSFTSQPAYNFLPPQQTTSINQPTSALGGAFGFPTNQPQQLQQRLPQSVPSFSNPQGTLSGFGISGNVFSSPEQANLQPHAIGGSGLSNPYRSNTNGFTFTPTANISRPTPAEPGRLTTHTFAPSYGQSLNPSQASSSTGQNHYRNQSSIDTLPAPNKRLREEPSSDDHDGETSASEQRDAKSKLPARACARCKNLKVKCEAKTETEPCKRCFNGGHECVIPGRKIRKVPPKREHLLSQIQSQASEIQRLMNELEKATSSSPSKRDRKLPDQIDSKFDSSISLTSPTLSPSSSTSPDFLGDHGQNGLVDEDKPMEDGTSAEGCGNHHHNAEGNKAISEWISKARDSLQEFGTFIGIGGATMPKNYLVDEDYEGSDSDGDDDFVDVQEQLDDGGSDEYPIAVERPADGEGHTLYGTPRLNSKTSASSLNTNGTAMSGLRKKKDSTSSKPAGLPVEASPFGLFGTMMLKTPKSRAGSEEPEDKGPGIANENFFSATPGPTALGNRLANAQHQWPAILLRGIITPEEAEALFKIYFDDMNLSLSLLDPVLYTAQRTLFRSPFLFTVICAIASRFYTARLDLYPQAMHYAQLAAGTALISGNKNVEMCQAYILLSLYPVPARKWEDQRSWLYLGLAIRAATDLNLHLPTTAKPLNENHAREMLNRTRVWLNCFNLDRSTGSQYGKPPIINSRDYTASHSEHWWCSSPYNMKNFDIQICAYNAELQVMAGFIATIYSDPRHPTGLNKEVDFEAVATETDDKLQALYQKWMGVIHEKTDMNDPHNSFRTGLLNLAYSYARLVALSYGFQHALGKNDGKYPLLHRCIKAASDVVNAVVHDICRPTQVHFWRHGPEAQSVFVTFAAAFLVKLLQPKFAPSISIEERTDIRARVQSVIDLLGSPQVALDERHGPKLYSRFLEKLLSRPMAKHDPMTSPASSSSANRSRPPPRRTKGNGSSNNPSDTDSQPPSSSYDAATFDLPPTVFNHPSPSNSLSPPPTSVALSFDHFAPLGGIDPFAPTGLPSVINATETGGLSNGLFDPPLSFDPEIMQSYQSLTDPNAWNDISFPPQFQDFGNNWLNRFQQTSNEMYDQSNYMTQ